VHNAIKYYTTELLEAFLPDFNYHKLTLINNIKATKKLNESTKMEI